MNKKLLPLCSIILIGLFFAFTFLYNHQKDKNSEPINNEIVKLHEKDLLNSPFTKTLKLTKLMKR